MRICMMHWRTATPQRKKHPSLYELPLGLPEPLQASLEPQHANEVEVGIERKDSIRYRPNRLHLHSIEHGIKLGRLFTGTGIAK